jgi:hypothetical protein
VAQVAQLMALLQVVTLPARQLPLVTPTMMQVYFHYLSFPPYLTLQLGTFGFFCMPHCASFGMMGSVTVNGMKMG